MIICKLTKYEKKFVHNRYRNKGEKLLGVSQPSMICLWLAASCFHLKTTFSGSWTSKAPCKYIFVGDYLFLNTCFADLTLKAA